MKATLTIIFLFLVVANAKADYRALSLYEMIIRAESIVYGEITALDSTTFTFKIEQNLTGEESELKIQRFHDWPCAHRWTEYEVGQKLFLLLTTYEGKIHTMSAGNEGELPIYNDSVFIKSLSLSLPPPPKPDGKAADFSKNNFFESQKHEIYGKSFFGYKTDLNMFIETVLQIRNCFEVEYNDYNAIDKAIITCDEDDLKKELATNKILGWTYNKLKK